MALRRQLQILSSRVGRRMLLLFVAVAFLPIGVFGALSVNSVRQELIEAGQRELHREIKAVGNTILGRLDQATGELTRAGAGPTDGQHLAGAARQRRTPDTELLDRTMVAADAAAVPGLTAADRLRLGQGLPVLKADAKHESGPRLLLVAAADGDANRLLVGEVTPALLRDFPVSAEARICIGDAAGVPLSCDAVVGPALLVRAAGAAATDSFGGFQTAIDGEQHLVRFWSMFLESRFGTPPWTLVIAEPVDSVQAALGRFMHLFPPVAGISLLAILLLSISQIRRQLGPLEKLRDAAQNVTARGLSAPVEISSGDEFEGLADTFNAMTKRLSRQFRTLQTLAEIDRIVLSSLDADYIVETLIERIGDVIECHSAGLLLLERDQAGRGELRARRRDACAGGATRHVVDIPHGALDAFPADAGPVVHDTPLPPYLAPLADGVVSHVIVFPIRLEDKVIGLLCSGHAEAPDTTREDIAHAQGLADRAAVAMSNAAWEEKLYRQAHYDALTGLPNRVLLRDRLEQALARSGREGTLVAVFFVDLDRFKSVNDSLGHAIGDRLLVEIAARLSGRGSDTVVRFGGDEFVIILPDLPDDQHVTGTITAFAESLHCKLDQPVVIDGRELHLTASIGIAVCPRDATSFDDLLRNADTAMYHAKDSGKARTRFFSRALDHLVTERLELESDLRQALRTEQLEVYYQPKADLATGELWGAEALVRWNHPTRGIVHPDKFIPIAEESDLIIELDRWMLVHACRQLAAWHAEGLPRVSVAVNLSARQFATPNLVDCVRETLEESGLAARFLELEVTEGAVMRNLDVTIAALEALSSLGVDLAIDDFGTGYSSLAYLARFPIDVLKIDRYFVTRMTRDPAIAGIVDTIIKLGHGLKLRVVAEGAETEEQLEFLRVLGCDLVQGYVIGRPLPAAGFARILANPATLSPAAPRAKPSLAAR